MWQLTPYTLPKNKTTKTQAADYPLTLDISVNHKRNAMNCKIQNTGKAPVKIKKLIQKINSY